LNEATLLAMVEQTRIQANAPAPRALRVEQAARSLGLGRTTFYGLIADGSIRTLKVGARRLVPVEALDEFLQRSRESDATEPTH
jgi:excisionase family DNA binding protein